MRLGACAASGNLQDDIVAARLRSDGGRAWARVASLEEGQDGETMVVGLLREVPCEWLAGGPASAWPAAEWPAERSRGSAAEHGCSTEQRLPRDCLDLRVPCPRYPPGAPLPLTEEGYRAAVSLRSTPKMADFISRVVGELVVDGCCAGRVLDRRRLQCFARWFSGEASVQSLAQIQHELPGKEAEHWVTFAPPKPTRCLEPAAPAPTPQGAEADAGSGLLGSEACRLGLV